MAQSIRLWGATYSNVPGVDLPKSTSGTARFTDTSVTTAVESDVASGKIFIKADGTQATGTASGGGGGGVQIGTAIGYAVSGSAIAFYDLQGTPTSFAVCADENISYDDQIQPVGIVFDGVSVHSSMLDQSGIFYDSADVTYSYSEGNLLISTSETSFVSGTYYKLAYTYGGSSSDIHTANVQVGSGATSITFPVTGRPAYWSCIFKSDFSTSSGYQRVIEVVNDGSSIYGLEMDSSAHAATSWTATYSGGNLTISSQSTNVGGYFHQPGYYQLTYYVDESAPQYQSKTVTPTTSQQTVTPDTGYDALSQVTVNAIPSEYIIPTGNFAITQNGNNINVAQYATVSVNVSGGGTLTVATKTLTHTSTGQTLSFTSLSGQPKYWFLRTTTNVSSSGSTTYYYVTDCFYDGTNIKGNTFRIGSTRRVQNITSGITQSYSNGTLTITAGSSSTATPGQFYGASNFGYELVYIY